MRRIVAVDSKTLLKRFIDFPHDLYANDDAYVPELHSTQRDLLSKEKNPFFRHAQVQLFLFMDNSVIKGRIAAIYNENHVAFTGKNEGFFGFFDCVNSEEVGKELFEAAAGFLREKGVDSLIGPVNPSTNDACGVLVSGFESPPTVLMPYNAPYYDELINKLGFEKWTDLLAYEIKRHELSSRVLALHDLLIDRLARNHIVIRPIRMKEFAVEVEKIKHVYNAAWNKNLGFMPMNDAEFDKLAADLKLIVRPEMCLVAEKDGQVVAWLLGIPDLNQILIKIKRGRLFPTGIFKLLTQLKNITRVRVMTLGVLEPYRKLGIESALYTTLIRNLENTKIDTAECSWLLEENKAITSVVEKLNARPYKRYRMYKKSL